MKQMRNIRNKYNKKSLAESNKVEFNLKPNNRDKTKTWQLLICEDCLIISLHKCPTSQM